MNNDFTDLLAIADQALERLTKSLRAKFGDSLTKEQVVWAQSVVLRQGFRVRDPDFPRAMSQAIRNAIASNVDAKTLLDEPPSTSAR
jgi:hypothetical protein